MNAKSYTDGYLAALEDVDIWLRTHLPRVIENYPLGSGKTTDMLNEDMRADLRESLTEYFNNENI